MSLGDWFVIGAGLTLGVAAAIGWLGLVALVASALIDRAKR